ncbi:MAG: hypothetical protein MJZ29_05440 [Bacteroidaceae bacterium]|nr:hypothetical protein [Bacteroidaceae bacterium]
MTIIDDKNLLTDEQKELLLNSASPEFKLGGYKSLADILNNLGVTVHILPGIVERSTACLDAAKEFWEKKLKSQKESEIARRNLEVISAELQAVSCEYLRGCYIHEQKKILLYPEEMKTEYDGERMNELLVSTLAHETMHAYFSRPHHDCFPYAYFVEEPLAEFGMLLYLQETRMPDILDWAKKDVAKKRSCYRYGATLFKQYCMWNPFLRKYLEEYKYNINEYEMLDVAAGESAIGLPYPVPSKLREIAIPHTSVGGRFCFDATSSWRSNGKSLYFRIPLAIANDLNFRASYKSKDRIHITFKDKSGGVYFIGDASIVSLDSTPRISVIGGSIGLYRVKLGVNDYTSYSFYEVSSNEWIAREL